MPCPVPLQSLRQDTWTWLMQPLAGMQMQSPPHWARSITRHTLINISNHSHQPPASPTIWRNATFLPLKYLSTSLSGCLDSVWFLHVVSISAANGLRFVTPQWYDDAGSYAMQDDNASFNALNSR
ncbi:uncharacterized protein Triagg1_8912 [Trichoderma aggressivum f. europaeum]|uniref:Uncharacterized protein n=1 Tax=Trichoderma aggressivum f. europaeum TaxID=173218 RepID=A0AAE1M1E7_9HYPO|nr:hypothetical protein Triagg1_8912 [Trichoderma aggressivum f. europaeum]